MTRLDYKSVNSAKDEDIYGQFAPHPNMCVVFTGKKVGRAAQWVGVGVSDVYGYSPTEYEADPNLWTNIIHPEDRQRMLQAYEKLKSGERIFEEYRLFDKSGQQRWILEIAGPAKSVPDRNISSVRVLIDITQSKTGQLLNFKVLTDNSPLAILILADERVVYSNESAAQLLGRESAEEIRGLRIDELMSRQSADDICEKVSAHLDEGPWSGDISIVRTDGTKLELRASLNSTGGGLVAIFTDITRLKQSEATLRAAQKLLSAVQDALAANFAVVDGDGVIITVNERWRQFARENGDPDLQHTCEGTNYLDVVRRAAEAGSQDAAEALAGIMSVLNGDVDAYEVEYPCRNTSDGPGWFLMKVGALTSDYGGAVIAHIDVTKQRVAEEALLESERKIRSLIDNVDAIIFRLDPNHNLIALIGRSVEKFGFSLEEVLRCPTLWWSTIHKDDRAIARVSYERAAATGQLTIQELRLVDHRTNEIRWVRSHITPKFDDSGNIQYFDGVAVDITERMEAQIREEKRAREIALINDINRQLESSLDTQQVLDNATRRICEALDSSSLAIMLEPSAARLRQLSICRQGGETITGTDHITAQAEISAEEILHLQINEPVLIPDLRQTSPVIAFLAEMAAQSKANALGPALIAPLYAGIDSNGVLIAVKQSGEIFEEDDLWVLGEIATHISAALANAANYTRQSRIAETLQRSLMPTNFDMPFLDIAALYSPAPGEMEVGGDFLSIFKIDEDRVGLVVGDVSGKGVEAAVHTAEARYMLRALAHQNPDPAYVISQLNDTLCDFLSEETFITLVYFMLEAKRQVIEYVNAGHEAPMLIDCPSGKLIELPPNGPVLGVTKKTDFKTVSIEFHKNDMLFCYTDGVADLRVDGSRFGYERLHETVRSAPKETAHAVRDHVVNKLRSYGEHGQSDDQVVVVIRSLA